MEVISTPFLHMTLNHKHVVIYFSSTKIFHVYCRIRLCKQAEQLSHSYDPSSEFFICQISQKGITTQKKPSFFSRPATSKFIANAHSVTVQQFQVLAALINKNIILLLFCIERSVTREIFGDKWECIKIWRSFSEVLFNLFIKTGI